MHKAHWIPGPGIKASSNKQDALWTETKTIIQLLLLLLVIRRTEVTQISDPIENSILPIISLNTVQDVTSDRNMSWRTSMEILHLIKCSYWIEYFTSQVQEAHWIPKSGITTSSKQDPLNCTEIKTIIQLLLLVVIERDEVSVFS